MVQSHLKYANVSTLKLHLIGIKPYGFAACQIAVAGVLLSHCIAGWAINKCIDSGGNVSYQEQACKNDAKTASYGDPTSVPISKPSGGVFHVPSPVYVSKDVYTPPVQKSDIAIKMEAAMKASDEKIAEAKLKCGGKLPTYPSIGMSESDFLQCTVIGTLTKPIVNTTETAAGILKQYVLGDYGISGVDPKYVYVTNGKVTAIQR